jgi:hypothetical protein
MSLATSPYANRGPIEITSISTALTYTPAIRWIQIITAGSGGLVVKDEGGVARTYAGLLAGDVLAGPFTELTSMTLSKIRVGDGPAPAGSQPAAIASLFTDATSSQGSICMGPSNFYLLTGAPLAIFANGASAVPGSALADSKAFAIQWNNNATLNGVVTSFLVPPDMDITQPATIYVRASKSGATTGDAVTFAVGLYNQVIGALHDADTNYGGTTAAMSGAATAKTVQSVSLAVLAADLAAFPASVTLTLKPTDGTLGTDDLYVFGVRVQYTRKLLVA